MLLTRCACGCSPLTRRAFIKGMASVGTVAAVGAVDAVGTRLAPSTAAAQAGSPSTGAAELLIRNVRIADDKPPVDMAISQGRFVSIQPNIAADAPRSIDAGGRAAI